MPDTTNSFKEGVWLVDCDECGFTFKSDQVKKDWQNLYKCKDCYEPRHPLDFVRGVKDSPSAAFVRKTDAVSDTNSTDVGGNSLVTNIEADLVGDANKTLTLGTDNTTQIWNTTLTANRTVTLTASGATGQQFHIYTKHASAFTLDVGGLQTIPASVNALVVVEYDGSGWVLIEYLPEGL